MCCQLSHSCGAGLYSLQILPVMDGLGTDYILIMVGHIPHAADFSELHKTSSCLIPSGHDGGG
jgi:hypothetical protein